MPKLTPLTTLEDFKRLHRHPDKYLALAEAAIAEDPDNPEGYWVRYHALEELGRKEEALADLERSMGAQPHWIQFEAKGLLLRDMGRYTEALAAFNKSENMNPEEWSGGFGRLFRADTYARMGNEAAALADCMRLSDDHWTPGLKGAPAGNKHAVAAELRRRAAAAKWQN